MGRASLLLPPDLLSQVVDFFEPRAAAVDAGQAGVREGLEFLHCDLLPSAYGKDGPNSDLMLVASTIASVAWCDMSSAFSLWCHRMVLEYLWYAYPGSPPRSELLPKVLRTELLGSTALAGAMAHYVSGVPLSVTWRQDGDELVVEGRINWASNLFPPRFVMITAAVNRDTGQEIIVALPGSSPGLQVEPYPQLLALQATGSSAVLLHQVRVGREWTVSDDFRGFIECVRPVFLLLQSSFAWGLAERALDEARKRISGVNEVLRADLDQLEEEAGRLATLARTYIASRGRGVERRELVALRLACAQLATAAVALEAKVIGGRGYVHSCATARRLREAAFLPIQAPTEGQLRWELSHCV